MDVLRPQIVCIEGRCYRKNLTYNSFVDDDDEEQYSGSRYDEGEGDNFGGYDDHEYADEASEMDVEETDNGYRIRLDIPSAFFKYIIGKKGETKKRLERETRTQIRIPRQGEEGAIIVSGQDRTGVISARTRIEVLVDSARQKQPFTHFLSLPLNLPQVQEKFEEFKEDVLRFYDGDRGIDSSIFQNSEKLHLTIGILALMDASEVEKATQLLDSCIHDLMGSIVGDRPLKVQLRGLEYMNDDPGEVDVLYCRVEPQDGTDRIQLLADGLVERFVSSGLMQRQYDRVKLHITMMNTMFRKDSSGTAAPVAAPRDRGQANVRPRESFDARGVLKQFGDYNFGAHTLTSVHLSQRYSTACNGYYSSAAKVDLPPLCGRTK